jgi:multiple sugar transport system ATP-binding protein
VPQLSLQAVSKVYGGTVVALDGIDLDVAGSQILGIVGPSGSGKSTLLRIIAGLEPLSSGHVVLDGRIVDDLPPRDRDVALMFQEHTLFPHMTVRGNLGFGLRLRRVPRDESGARIADAAATLGLGGLLDRYPDQLSGGERQRVALGRALVRRPRLLLLDEPLSSVDAQLRIQLRVEITRTCRTLGAILILVTHDQMDAMAIADRIAVMRQGRIEQIGDSSALYDYPANRFVAEFIGLHGMNLFDGHLQRIDSHVSFAHPEFSVDLPADWCARLDRQHAAGVTLGIRPEGLAVMPPPARPTRAILQATVEIVKRIGPQVFVHCTVGARRCSGIADVRNPPQPGDIVAFAIDPRAVRLFDAEGRSL